MSFSKTAWDILISLRAAVWLLAAEMALLFYGAFVMPKNQVFEQMNTMSLFEWLATSGLAHTWWLWGAISILALLTLNTLLCSIDSVFKKKSGILLVISPQIIHIGFLFILLAHFLSSWGGHRQVGGVPEGAAVRLPYGFIFKLNAIETEVSPQGFITNWRARVQFIGEEGQEILKEDFLAPNRPSFFRGFGFYLKDLRLQPSPVALIEVSREPGALWALIGGILFTIGTVMLVSLRIKQE